MTPTNREADQWCKVQHMAAARKAQAARLALVMAKMKPRQSDLLSKGKE